MSNLIRPITNKLNNAVSQIPQGSAANKLHTNPHRKTNDVAETPEGEFLEIRERSGKTRHRLEGI